MECFHALVKVFKYKEIEVKKRLIAIIDSKNVIMLDISTPLITFAFEITEKYRTGEWNSLIAINLLENKIQELNSQDSGFDSILLLKRIDPLQIKILIY